VSEETYRVVFNPRCGLYYLDADICAALIAVGYTHLDPDGDYDSNPDVSVPRHDPSLVAAVLRRIIEGTTRLRLAHVPRGFGYTIAVFDRGEETVITDADLIYPT
jgi:hypothetical protein